MAAEFHETTPAAWPAQRGSAEGGCQSSGPCCAAIGSRKPTLGFHPLAGEGRGLRAGILDVSSLTGLGRGDAPEAAFSVG